jgi:hypothetical protein
VNLCKKALLNGEPTTQKISQYHEVSISQNVHYVVNNSLFKLCYAIAAI